GGTWTEVPSLDFIPLKTGTAAALDGNAAGHWSMKTGSIDVRVANNQELWFRWTKKGTSSCGLAVDDFSVVFEPTTQPANLAFSFVTATMMTVSFAAPVPASSGCLALRKEGSAPAGVPADGVSYTPGDTLGDALVVYSGSGASFAQTGLNPTTLYYYSLFAFNESGAVVNYLTANPLSGSRKTEASRSSIASDVIAVPLSESAVLSSTVTDPSPLTAATGMQVWQFTVRDGGNVPDSDTKPTIVTGISVTQGPGNTVADWTRSILAADLFDGAVRLTGGSVNSQSIVFTGFTCIVPDGSSKTFSLRLSLKKNGVVDHQVFQCALSPALISTESDSLSSLMKSFAPVLSDGTKNVFQVIATKLNFSQPPGACAVGEVLPPVMVAATDSNSNRDIDFNGSVTLTANGATLIGSPVTASAAAGMAAYSTLVFSTPGAVVTLTAVSGSWSSTSSAFQVAAHRTYHVDSISGNDAADGLSASTAWKTLTKVNAVVFQPGDSVLFKSGCTWTGTLRPMGSGDSTAAIVIDLYGGIARPVINGNGVVGTAAVYFTNQQYWEVNNLEITNPGATGADRRGVYITASNFGLVRHWYLRNLYIHDVAGTIGDAQTDKKTAGIGIDVTNDATKATRYDDILIDGCTIANCNNQGLYTDFVNGGDYPMSAAWMNRRFTNVRIRNNTIHHISKNAMIIRYLDGGVIERNVCYETAIGTTGNTMFTVSCSGTVFQYNEGYYNRASTQGNMDGSMYDADLRSTNITFQYSYSHDNSHGLLWTCTDQADSNVVCRYNVSKNDKGIIFCINYPNTSVYCYNNTVYVGAGLSPVIISERNGGTSGTPRKYYFYNNIVYNLGSNATYEFHTNYTRIIGNNLFYGFHPSNEPQDLPRVTADPQFVNPATGFTTGLNSVAGFALKSTSPAINAGIMVPRQPNQDYLGNPVPTAGAVDMGAFEFQAGNDVSKEAMTVPRSTQLKQNYPNPFNPTTSLEFAVAATGEAAIEVYSLLGVKVASVFRGIAQAGRIYTATFDATHLSSGVYLYKLTAGSAVLIKKMILMR
ncbi:MAG: T9SS type A sorting domain-containing protein, partial [Ignavibacteriales bacterium]|nr:T9SS type A sorting domain-containing protein [Ignavibacteriales bacterium]